ncbi:MAG: thermonuclease family protein [Solirubrobacterales bacterium]
MSTRRAAGWVALFGALVLVAFQVIDSGGSSAPQSPAAAGEARTARVLRVVDGDTILVKDTGGRTERVRYIGVDTPESVKPNAPVDCFGHEASDFNRRLVQGRTVKLIPDREATDKYGRSLAFVYVGDTLVQAQLLENGYARTLEIEPNTSKAEYFAKLERVAISTNKGLWRACDR